MAPFILTFSVRWSLVATLTILLVGYHLLGPALTHPGSKRHEIVFPNLTAELNLMQVLDDADAQH